MARNSQIGIKSLGESIGMNIEICEQENLELGMSGAVMSSKDLISNGPVLIFSSNDVVEEKAFQSVLDAFKNVTSNSGNQIKTIINTG